MDNEQDNWYQEGYEAGSEELEKWKQIATDLYKVLAEGAPVGRYPEYPQYQERKTKVLTEYEKAIKP